MEFTDKKKKQELKQKIKSKEQFKGGGWRCTGVCSCAEMFTPENITALVSLVSISLGLATTSIKALKLWIDDRKNRKIKLRHKEYEIEISGGISQKEISEKLRLFKSAINDIRDDEVEIIVIDK